MIKRHNTTSLVWGVPGIIMQFGGNFFSGANPATAGAGSLICGIGSIMLIIGLCYYALAKGRSGWWGACGLLSCFGLLILILLKDKSIETSSSENPSPVVDEIKEEN